MFTKWIVYITSEVRERFLSVAIHNLDGFQSNFVMVSYKTIDKYCVAVFIFSATRKLRRKTLKLRRKLRCDTAYWQHWNSMWRT